MLDPTICVEGDCAEALALLSQMLDEDRDGAGLLTATVPPRGTWDGQIDTRTERDGQTYRQTDGRAVGLGSALYTVRAIDGCGWR